MTNLEFIEAVKARLEKGDDYASVLEFIDGFLAAGGGKDA